MGDGSDSRQDTPMTLYHNIADDFYVNMQLQTTLELPQNRESLIHFFEQVQRRYPKMKVLTQREREFFLEEDKEESSYRWVSADSKRLSSGVVNPETLEDAAQLHREVLGIVPYSLSVSHLDCEALNLVYGFDFTYRGNHNQLLADAIGLPPAFESMIEMEGAKVLGYEPSLQLTLDAELKTQARISFETRTSPFSLKTGEYPEEQLSVYLSLRRIDSLGQDERFDEEIVRLSEIGKRLLDEYMVPHVLKPLQKAISLK